MGKTILYGVDGENKIYEIEQFSQSMRACFPIWNYLDKKYFSSFRTRAMEFPCWGLTPQTVTKEEYFMLLTSFDGYYFLKENISEMITLLEVTHNREDNPVNSSRLEIFKKARENEDFNKFFIIATDNSSYENFIDYKDYRLTNETWNIWGEYLEDIKQYNKIETPSCNWFFFGLTIEEYEKTVLGMFKMNPKTFPDTVNEEQAIKRAEMYYDLAYNKYEGCIVYENGLVGRTGNLENTYKKEGDFPINTWSEEKQQFITTTMKEILAN